MTCENVGRVESEINGDDEVLLVTAPACCLVLSFGEFFYISSFVQFYQFLSIFIMKVNQARRTLDTSSFSVPLR